MDKINLENSQKQLRYVAVYDKLFKMINEGIFKEGARLPSEPELAKSLGVSRTTLRQALALLQDDGLIKNIQGKGNFILKSTENKNSGIEVIENPVYKCITENIDSVEMEFHIEIPNDYMIQVLNRKTAVCIVVDRWYKSKDIVTAYTFTLIPIETISENNIDLNNKDELLKFIQKDIYSLSGKSALEIRHSSSGNFTAKKYPIYFNGQCHLIQESLYTAAENNPAIFNKHYLPIDISSIKINLFK
ncbi:GntR family transcriptional regulator [uncultured Clostridium sp.]|uniref:GntR family transcriptional regulator n=1 Tax=uncultured Clostridium sp. TaxID=59620 RepID=UPI0025DC0A05|nr:GntR family transcriptional regulator [uncultured Clostridium sp.]